MINDLLIFIKSLNLLLVNIVIEHLIFLRILVYLVIVSESVVLNAPVAFSNFKYILSKNICLTSRIFKFIFKFIYSEHPQKKACQRSCPENMCRKIRGKPHHVTENATEFVMPSYDRLLYTVFFGFCKESRDILQSIRPDMPRVFNAR